MITLIAAASENNVIGRNQDLPWELPDDLRRFRKRTRGCPVIMGRKNYESIAARIGGPLPKRRNIVVTHQSDLSYEGCDMAASVDEAIAIAKEDDAEEIFVIGGGQIYAAALSLADRIDLTRVHADIEGDVFFPEIDFDEWVELAREKHLEDEEHAYAFTHFVLERKL